ncbi:MAG: hypothetical protein ACOY3E_03030 [Pseudomonadota bacterium]
MLEIWRQELGEIASSVQMQYGSTVASDTGDAGANLVVMVRVYGFWSPIGPFYVPFDGNTSIGKAVLNHANVDKGKPDPNPCDPEKNDDNSNSDASTGGGGATEAARATEAATRLLFQMEFWSVPLELTALE